MVYIQKDVDGDWFSGHVTNHRPHISLYKPLTNVRLAFFWDILALKDGPQGCPEMSVMNYHCMTHNIAEEHKSHFFSSGFPAKCISCTKCIHIQSNIIILILTILTALQEKHKPLRFNVESNQHSKKKVQILGKLKIGEYGKLRQNASIHPYKIIPTLLLQ